MGRRTSASSVFQAIADPKRRAVLDGLRGGERSVTDMGRPLRISQSALSQHLSVLRRAGLVTRRRAGRQQLYRLRPEPLEEVARWIAYYDQFWKDRLDRLGKYLERKHGEQG
jgi:DNA-binding transcriptional ArsR family regulator